MVQVVDDPMAMLRTKFGNMLTYVQDTYKDVDVTPARALTTPAVVALVRSYFSDFRDAIVEGDMAACADGCDQEYRALVRRAADDDKLRRYLVLFIDLCA